MRAYPGKPVRLIVAAPPGGVADAVARLVGDRLHESWRQPVVIDNRPGANGIIGAEMTARAAPDGHTIAMVASGFAINPSLYTRVPYDPVRDFVPISLAVTVPNIVVVHPTQSFSSLADLVAAARQRRSAIAIGTPGRGSSGHLALVLFQVASAARFTHVPYRASASGFTDLVGTDVQALFGLAPSVMPHVKSGRLKALAVTSAARMATVPDLATVAESGYPGYEADAWFGVLAPARTPAPISARLSADVQRILRAPELRQRLTERWMKPLAGGPKAFARHIAVESQRWSNVIKQAGIRAD